MSLERLLQELADHNRPLRHTALIDLSNLSASEMARFAQIWPTLNPSRRRKVVNRLVELAEENAELDFSAVFRCCLRDADEEVRGAAIPGLWEFEDRTIIPTLLEMLREDPCEQVRAAAAIALGKFASLAQQGKLLERDSERIREALLSVLQNHHEPLEVSRRALEAAALYNTREVAEYIWRAYQSQNHSLQCSSIYAMGQTGELSWLPVLLKELKSSSPAIRYETVQACAELADEEAVPHLIPLLEDDDLEVQISSIRALSEIGGPLARRALRRCVHSSEEIVSQAAQEALENMEAIEDPLAFRHEV
ncbi:MAG: HEAT repeat domain-containing protein [Dehalococcoidia bacterium]